MNLLERYLQAVKFFLPAEQQEDIIRELRENLTSQIDDREQSLSRPIETAEISAILRDHGHPMIVAGRYRRRQHLIGPVFFALYATVLKWGLGIAALVVTVLTFVNAALHGDLLRRAAEAFLAYPGIALQVFAWTTLGFAMLDLMQSHLKLPRTWDPGQLPKLHTGVQIPFAAAFAEFIFVSAFLIYLLLVPRSQWLTLGPGAVFFSPAPVWSTAYNPIVVLTLATGILALVNLLRPQWTPARSVARIAIHAGSLGTFLLLLQAGEWIVPKPGAILPGGASVAAGAAQFNNLFQIGLIAACLIAAVELARESRRLYLRRRAASNSAAPAAVR